MGFRPRTLEAVEGLTELSSRGGPSGLECVQNRAKPTQNRLIFVGGCPRSGTTLVQNMLDCHPEILGGPEFLHLVDVIRLRSTLLASVSRGWIDLFCSAEDVDRHIRSLIENLLLPFADARGATLLSEKSPDNILVMSELVELFPDAKFICVVRDPRAIVASLLAVGRKARSKGERPAPFTADVQSAIHYADRCLREGFKAAAAAPDKVYLVHYESLVTQPEQEGRRLCAFLGLDWCESMLRPGEKKHLGEAAITVNSKELWYDLESYYANPNTASVDKWQSGLAAREQILVNRVFRHSTDLRDLGYDFSGSSLSLKSHIVGMPAALLTRLRWGVLWRLRALLH